MRPRKLRTDERGQRLAPWAPVAPERTVLSTIMQVLNRTPGVVAFRNNTGLFERGGRKVRAGVGGKGAADVYAFVSVRDFAVVIALEVKREDTYAKPHQKAWLADMARRGIVCGVVRSVQDALALVEEARRRAA